MGKRKGGVETVLEKDYSFLKRISKSLEPSKKKSRNTHTSVPTHVNMRFYTNVYKHS